MGGLSDKFKKGDRQVPYIFLEYRLFYSANDYNVLIMANGPVWERATLYMDGLKAVSE